MPEFFRRLHSNSVFVQSILLCSCLFNSLSSCPDKPLLKVTNEKAEGLQDVSAQLQHERGFYMKRPMEISLSCSANKPIEVEVDGEMPVLVKDVYYSREVQDFFDSSTYCYSIVFKLPADLRVTGNYTCSDSSGKQHASSILIFSNGEFGSGLLVNGTTSIKGVPDENGWIRIPCVSTNPFLIPKIFKVNDHRDSHDILPVAMEVGAIEYEPGRGFRIKALSQHCCSKKYLCELVINPGMDVDLYSSTTVILYKTEALGGKVFSRVNPSDYILGFNPEMETEVRVRISGPIRIQCESNALIHLETTLQPEDGMLRAFFAENRNSFYRFRASMLGKIDKVGVVTATCKEDGTQRELHKWKITTLAEAEFSPAPGIHIFTNKHYPITCYSSNGKTASIFIIQCNDPINCHTAEKFSHLVLKHQSETIGKEVYPFDLIPGHRSCVRESRESTPGCAQMSNLGSKRGIVKCTETTGDDNYIVYTENFVIGLNNSIIRLSKFPRAEAGKNVPRHALLGIEPINDIIYVDEEIRIRCNASYGVFSGGIQLMLQLRSGENLTIGDFTNLQFHEHLEKDNPIMTYEGKIKIDDANIERIWCFAPIWNTDGWRSVSEEVVVKEGRKPTILDGTQNVTLVFERGESGRNLTCQVSGDPPPKVKWFKDSDGLSEKNTKVREIERTEDLSVLHLAQIVEAHDGEYSCEVTNVKGKTFKYFRINVYGTQNLSLYLGVGGSILVLAGIVICILIKLLRNRSNTIERLTEMEIHEFEFGNQNLAKKFAELNENARYLPYKQDFEISKVKLEIKDDEVLGAGAFGLVLKGYFTRHSERFPVAIKTVRSNADISHLRNLLSEIKILMYIGNHPNIIGLFGAITRELREGKLHVVVEFCGNGNLLSFLRECRHSFINQITANGKLDFTKNASQNHKSLRPASNLSTKSWKLDDFLPEPRTSTEQRRRSSSPIKTWDLLNWALQIATGMVYLGTKKVIHGDLATRNLLLTQDLVVKITDFGLSSHLYDYTNYIKKQKEDPVPWRWLSVEAIRDSKFSIQTDIWAYGVTLWEIFSLAEVPYQGFSWGTEFVDKLYAGLRLPSPPYANPAIYTEMEKCWATEPSDRPSFSHLQIFFANLLKNSKQSK